MNFKLDKNVALRNITLAITSKADKELVVGYFLSDLSKYPKFDPNLRGRYNGYVILGKDHPFNGVRDIIGDYDVHGGITLANKLKDFNLEPYPELWAYADHWVVGFDTAHVGDNDLKWTLERATDETRNLYALMLTVEEYQNVYLRDISARAFFKIKDCENIYFYDGFEERLFKIGADVVELKFPETPYMHKIKILHKF